MSLNYMWRSCWRGSGISMLCGVPPDNYPAQYADTLLRRTRCYAIHSARMFFDGAPVAATAIARYAESGADIMTSGVLDFGEGPQIQFDFSFERARRSEYEVIGSKGGVKCHTVWQLPGDVPIISWWTEDGWNVTEQMPPANHFKLEIEHFSDCALNGKAPLLSLEDAKLNCRSIVAAMQSAAEGRTVRL